jgi:anthranilate phosphoribosyltransferase
MDEISPLGPTHVVEIRDGAIREWTIDPTVFGFKAGDAGELEGGTPAQNAAVVSAVLDGSAPATATAAVILNAAAALYIAPGGPGDYGDAINAARAGLKDGAGVRALERLRAAHRTSL